MSLKHSPFHPFLIVAFQILTVYSININEASFSSFMFVLFISLLFTSFVYFIISLFINSKLSAIVVTFYGFLFFAYGRILDIIIDYSIFSFDFGRNRYLLPFYAIIVTLGTIWIIKSKFFRKNLIVVTKYFNSFSLGLISIAILTSMMNFDWTLLLKKDVEKIKSAKNINQISKENDKTKPNIYYLIFDSYPNSRILNKYYNWDDNKLLNELTNRGFSINKNAQSNYCFTGASITSTLSMRYIHKDSGFLDAYNQDNYIESIYKNNLVMNRFQSEGYRIITNIGGSKFPMDRKSSFLEDDFLQLIIHISLLRVIENKLVTEILRQETLSLLEEIRQFKKTIKPTFMFLHVMIPHSPFVFKANGSSPQFFESSFGKFEDKIKFVEQVRFTGNQILRLVDHIQFNDPYSIIFIQSDHGYGGMDDDIYLNRNSLAAKSNISMNPPNEYFDARFGILSAVYFPNNMPVPQIQSPVNNFRFVFNALFDDELSILPDKSYFTVIKQPYLFHDVTGVIEKFIN